ncbi:MAG TPA: Ppx/GppA phosphatase family protein [Nocardioides sp.]|nr:Ppx/GppA phosphatase family protein [Nocardioides sp.]
MTRPEEVAQQPSRRVAAIDCGTNTIRLLIGDPPEVAVRETRIVRLGEGVDRSGRLSDEALARAFAALEEYAALIREHDVSRVRLCATSATRDAANAEVFATGVRERLAVSPEVLTGDEEAALTFDGAVRHLRTPPATPVLVVDIGGGSTELVLGAESPDAVSSMDVGSVRLHERHLRDDPPTTAQIRACVADIDAALDHSPVDPASAATVVGVAGTTLSVVAGVLDLPAYDLDVLDQSEVPVLDVLAFVDRLVAMPLRQRLTLPWMHSGRADVIDAGALILSRVLRRTRVESLVASEADILDGIAWSMVG